MVNRPGAAIWSQATVVEITWSAGNAASQCKENSGSTLCPWHAVDMRHNRYDGAGGAGAYRVEHSEILCLHPYIRLPPPPVDATTAVGAWSGAPEAEGGVKRTMTDPRPIYEDDKPFAYARAMRGALF